MGSFSAKTRSSGLYNTLGLDQLSGEEAHGSPKVLSPLAAILEKLMKKNDKSSRKKRSVKITVFHGLRPPSLSVLDYLERISKYVRCSPSCFVIALIYIDRFVQQKNCLLTPLNVHRLLITSVMAAAKFTDDACFNNAYYAKVGGVSCTEMNKLEMELLFSLDFKLHVTLDTFDRCCLQLEKQAPESCNIQRPALVCGRKGNWKWGNKDDLKCNPKFAGYC